MSGHRLGRFHLFEVVESTFALDGGAMFGIVPKELWNGALPADPENRVPLAARCLLLTSETHRLLVDTGMGDAWPTAQRQQLALAASSQIDSGLARAGLSRRDITDVVLTHLHFDHAGGTVDRAGAASTLRFPNARHHLQRRHWDWAHHPSERDRGSFRRPDLEALADSGKLELLDGPQELLPGVSLFLSEGHTVGMQLLRVEGDGQAMIFCGDLIPTTHHLRATWGMAYDLSPLQVIEEKRMLLARATRENSILFLSHDPQLAACTVKEVDGKVRVDREVTL